jgi:hypothetical protein
MKVIGFNRFVYAKHALNQFTGGFSLENPITIANPAEGGF